MTRSVTVDAFAALATRTPPKLLTFITVALPACAVVVTVSDLVMYVALVVRSAYSDCSIQFDAVHLCRNDTDVLDAPLITTPGHDSGVSVIETPEDVTPIAKASPDRLTP